MLEQFQPNRKDGKKETLTPESPIDQLYSEIRAVISDSTGLDMDTVNTLQIRVNDDKRKTANEKRGDYGVAIQPLAPHLHRSPQEIGQQIVDSFTPDQGLIESIETSNGFLNVSVDSEKYATAVVHHILEMKNLYGSENIGKGMRVVTDMSSPNIAKPMSVGHLRSTIIGDSLARIYTFMGYDVIKDNHLGDWGTQFGHLLYAIEQWGDMDAIEKNPIQELKNLYVKVSELGEEDEAVVNAGRAWFSKLENGDPVARKLWQKTVDWSIVEFQQIYDALGIEFDLARGESFYEPFLKDTIKLIEDSGLAVNEEGALKIDLTDVKLKKVVIRKSDGASVYMTREIATGIHRQNEMNAEGMIYVVGSEQSEYFRQYIEIMKRLGYDIADKTVHVGFGLITLPEGKMSTRKGRVILLQDVLNEAVKRTEQRVTKKSKVLHDEERDIVTKQVAIGAVKWNDLMHNPANRVQFDWNRMLAMKGGDTAPYIQYTHARTVSILEKAGDIELQKVNPTTEIESTLVKLLQQFPFVVRTAANEHNPAKIPTYLIELAKVYNTFYHDQRILKAGKELKASRVALTAATGQVIRNGLNLLGIEAPERM